MPNLASDDEIGDAVKITLRASLCEHPGVYYITSIGVASLFFLNVVTLVQELGSYEY